MTIRITRNAAGNCLNFIGSSMPAYFNACLSGQVDPTDGARVNVVNDVQTANDPNGEFRYEFYQIPYTEFADKNGNPFASAQEAADYITQEGNVLGVADVGTSLNGITVNFRLDQTNTSIIMDNGAAFGVNTIKAVADADGTIHIHAIGAGVPADSNEPDDHRHFEGLAPGAVQINGVAVPGGINDVVNALNELFTVGPFEAVVVRDPYSTLIADVNGIPALYTLEGSTAIDPVGNDIFGNSSSGNYAGLKSQATIDQAGEYFTFDIRVEGQIGFGLVHSDASFAAGKYQGNATYADPSTFAVGNSAHYGYQFSHWFHPTPNGSWTNYGASTGYVMGPGWSNWDQKQDWLDGNPVKIRVGIDENGFIAISSLQDDGSWVLHARSSYPVPEGSEFHLGIKAAYPQPRVFSAPQVHLLEPAAPTLYFRYIESPDGYYSFPLFATQEEADYYEEQVSGSANGSHTHVYPDDPSQATWYMPNTVHQMNYGLTPVEDGVTTFLGNPINWTEITSLTNADLIPPVFTGSLTVDEGSAINYQTQPVNTNYTTTFSGLESVLDSIADSGVGTLQGTAPEVTGDNVANPSDVYTIGVHRTNTYGTSSGTLTLTVNNLTAPSVEAITGYDFIDGTPLIDDDTMAAGSVVAITETVGDGERLAVDRVWANALVQKVTAGTGTKRIFVGFPTAGADFSSGLGGSKFDLAYEFMCDDTRRANGYWTLRAWRNGTQVSDLAVGGLTSALYDYAFINDGGVVKIGGLVASQNLGISTYVFDEDDAAWRNDYTYDTLSTGAKSIYIITENTDLDLTLTGLSDVSEPAPPASPITTSWDKALDFSGGSERAEQVSSGFYRTALKMGGTANQVAAPAAGQTVASGHPWATAIVFKCDTYNDNQHIWNLGEGAGETDDNIYLRRDSSRRIWFGWGRTGDLNEIQVADIGDNIGGWHAVYVAHNGTRYGSGATAAQMAACFDIRYARGNQGWAIGTNRSTEAQWSSGLFGGSMDREFQGAFTVGGRGANRSFRGKVAAMVVTTLRVGVAMPTDAEIDMMIRDPFQWILDYKVGNSFRLPWLNSNAGFNFARNDGSSSYATQVWLMGDGDFDAYSQIRNAVSPYSQEYTPLNMVSMVSSDIENVTIDGLS